MTPGRPVSAERGTNDSRLPHDPLMGDLDAGIERGHLVLPSDTVPTTAELDLECRGVDVLEKSESE